MGYIYIYIQCGAPKIAKLVNITPITMVYGTQITIVFMGFISQLTTGGPHLAGTDWFKSISIPPIFSDSAGKSIFLILSKLDFFHFSWVFTVFSPVVPSFFPSNS